MALAHTVSNNVETAYRCSDLFEKRRHRRDLGTLLRRREIVGPVRLPMTGGDSRCSRDAGSRPGVGRQQLALLPVGAAEPRLCRLPQEAGGRRPNDASRVANRQQWWLLSVETMPILPES